jgi:surface antigen
MRKILAIMLISTFFIALAGCQGQSQRQQGGAILGGVLGGVLGSNVGAGQGKTAAIIGGTLLGAMVGSEIGRYMDETDELKSQRALELNRDHQTSRWHNPNTGADISTTPVSTYQTASGQNCREYQTEIFIDGKRERGHGTACRQSDGSWQIRN